MLVWYRPYIVAGDPHTFVAKYTSRTGKTQDLRFHGLVSMHNTDQEAVEACNRLHALEGVLSQ